MKTAVIDTGVFIAGVFWRHEPHFFQDARLKFRQDIHVAVLRIKIVTQDGAEQTQFADAPVTAETRDLLAVKQDRQRIYILEIMLS